MDAVFIKALSRNIRFPFRGSISTEDLFSLNLTQLDGIYRALNSAGKAEGEGLLSRRSKAATDNEIAREVVKLVFEYKQAEADALESRRARKARNEKILAIIEEKKEGALREKSLEELNALLREDEQA